MPAYIFVDIEILNYDEYEEYKKLNPASIIAYQGKFIVRGGNKETLERDWQPKRFVGLEFSTAERPKKWWASKEYEPAKIIRIRTARTKMIVAEGIEADN